MCDDGTIGDASSAATTLAASTTSALFTLLWTNFANAECAVSSGRGASAAADYAAHKTIALPKMLGRVYGIAGAGSGLTSRTIGVTVGEETHTLTSNEMPSHSHTSAAAYGCSSIGALDSFTGAGTLTPTGSTLNTIGNTGGGAAHNVMQPTVFLKMMVKL